MPTKKLFFLVILIAPIILLGAGCVKNDQSKIIEQQQEKIDELTNQVQEIKNTPAKTVPVKVESSQLKIERCKALATSKVSEQNFLTIEQRAEVLNKCNEPEWMFPDEKQPAYMSDTEWKDMLKRVCIEKLNKSLDELVEKDKNDAYSKYYSDCLNK